MSTSMFSPAPSRFFGVAPESAPTAPGHLRGRASPSVAPASNRQTFAARNGGAASAFGRHPAGAAKPAIWRSFDTASVGPRWQAKELRWLIAFVPEQQQNDLIFCLGETLRWRARECKPLTPLKKAVERSRFGLLGEQLWDIDSAALRKRLRAELRETIRTVEV